MTYRLKQFIRNNVHRIVPALVPLVLLAVFVISCLGDISYMSPTEDEPRHLIRGIMLLKSGDFRLNRNHPFFANTANALPLLFMKDIRLPSTQSEGWKRADTDEVARDLYRLNGGSRQFTARILKPARLATVAFMAMTLMVLFITLKKEWGIGTASLFLFLCAVEPNMVAHSSLVTTDSWVAILIFSTTYALYLYAKTPKKKLLWIFIILSFISLLTKYSSIPVAFLWLILLAAIRLRKVSTTGSFTKRLVRAALVSLGIAFTWALLLTAAYGFRFKTMAEISHADESRTELHLQKIAALTEGNQFLTKTFQSGYKRLPFPFPEYLLGFFGNVLVHNHYGHNSYLFGMYSQKGWWYYFPLVMLVKVPVPVLAGLGALLLYSAVWLVRRSAARREAGWRFPALLSFHAEYVLILVPLFFFALSMISNINIGLRHILPIFPFLFLAIGLLVSKYWVPGRYVRITTILLSLWFILSSFHIYPYHLEYFNELAGGPSNGYKYLLGSNLNWGQDEFLVQDYVKSLPEGTVLYINPLHEVEKGVVVIDVGSLMGRNPQSRPKTAWLRDKFLAGEIKPKHRIAYTHMVFEFLRTSTSPRSSRSRKMTSINQG